VAFAGWQAVWGGVAATLPSLAAARTRLCLAAAATASRAHAALACGAMGSAATQVIDSTGASAATVTQVDGNRGDAALAGVSATAASSAAACPPDAAALACDIKKSAANLIIDGTGAPAAKEVTFGMTQIIDGTGAPAAKVVMVDKTPQAPRRQPGQAPCAGRRRGR
jgi:hypothetical protein